MATLNNWLSSDPIPRAKLGTYLHCLASAVLVGLAIRSPDTMTLRDYIPADAELLADVYRDAARHLGLQGYTAEQTRVWAMHPEDLEEFRAALSEGLTVCAVVDDSPVAFGQLNPPDHIAYLYCHSAHARSGYASAILAKLEEHALLNQVTPLRVEASCVARPFFEHHGYRVVEEERPVRHGVEFLRFKMEKKLANKPSHHTVGSRADAPANGW